MRNNMMSSAISLSPNVGFSDCRPITSEQLWLRLSARWQELCKMDSCFHGNADDLFLGKQEKILKFKHKGVQSSQIHRGKTNGKNTTNFNNNNTAEGQLCNVKILSFQ